ncbi:hypothetical protein ACQ4PT_005700 [Festuca glaucescens]
MATSSKAPFLIRFGGRRLRKFVDNELSAAKRDVIAMSCFADLARISRFHVPEELLEWVVMNIDPKLREYCHKASKPIVFTRDMMTKVFNVPSGDRPVDRLKNTEHTELRNMYRDGERAPIAYLEKLLHDCADDDVVMIKRSFALLAFATVLFLGTNNMIVYVDHLDFPVEQVHGHVFDYSLPRALHVCNADFELAMAIDRNKKTLELSVFGKRPIRDRCNMPYALDQAAPAPQYVPFVQVQPAYQEPPIVHGQRAPQLPPVPTEFNALYEKHKTMFKHELNAALSSFGLVVQGIRCNRMALLLKDVSDAARNDSVQEGTNESNGINFDVPNLDPEASFRGGVSMGGVGSSPTAAAIIEEASVGIGGVFGAVIGDAVVSTVPVHTVDSTKDSSVPPRPPSPTPVAADAPLMDFSNKATEFHQVEKTIDELSSGPSMHEKRTRHKRVAVDFDSAPKMKKVKVNADADALYMMYVLHKQKTKKLKDGESYPPCFKIGGFFTSYQNWQASLRPRGDLDNEVMALYIEHFNLSHKTSRKCKKYAFSCLMSDLLSVNPARFVPSLNCLREFNRACDDFKAHKSDLDYIPIFWKIVAATLFNKPTNEIDAAVALAEQAP